MKTSFFHFLCLCILAFPFGSTAFAAKENFDRSKPHVYIGTIGYVDHGKTILTEALAKAFNRPLQTRVVAYEDVEGTGRIEMEALVTKIRTGHPQYHIHDFDEEGTVKNMVTGALRQDGSILVVSAADVPQPQTREHVLLARQVGVPSIVVFLNVDGELRPGEADAAEDRVRNLLAAAGYGENNSSIIRGSLSGAFDGDADGLAALGNLMDAVDTVVRRAVKPADQPFLMPVEDVFSITGRGTVATGRIETGRVNVGDEVEIVGLSDVSVLDVVTGIVVEGDDEADSGDAGDNVGVLLRGIEKSDIRRGMVIAKPGSVHAVSEFKAQVYLLTPEEGGSQAPFCTGYRPQFYLRTADVTGQIELECEGREMVMPGDNVEIHVILDVPVAMDKGLRFAIREGGRTVGAGQVTEILE